MKKICYFMMVIVVGCSYSVYTSGFSHLKSINVFVFENITTEYELEEMLDGILVDKFQNEARLKLINVDADCKIEGRILDYSKRILEYGEGNVDEYEVRILLDVTFTDLLNNEMIWQKKSLILSEKYSNSDVNEDESGDAMELIAKTEIEAQNRIFKALFEQIIKNSLEEW